MTESRSSCRCFLASLLLLASGAGSATFTVSKDGRGRFESIQQAVDAAGRNDTVEILDAAVYPEQVTLDASKSGLILRSAAKASPQKPVIRYQDVRNQGPKTCQEALDAANITFERNGALRLLETENVTLEGLAVDGGGPAPFEWASVWGNGSDCSGQLFPNFHGNAALVLHGSARATIRECAFRNAFFGVVVNDRSPTGAFALPSAAASFPVPGRPGFGGMGGHLIENNLFLENVTGVAGLTLSGLPSTLRNNRFFGNGHASYADARAVKRMQDGSHHVGGAVFMKGDPFCPWFFEHNTFQANYLIFNGNYRPNSNHLIQANLFGPPSRYWGADSVFPNPFQELLPVLWNGLRRNLVSAQALPPESQVCLIQFSAYDDSAGMVVRLDTAVTSCGRIPMMNGFPSPEIRPDTIRKDLLSGNRTFPTRVVVQRSLAFAPILDVFMGVEPARRQGNRWWEPRFVSQDPAAATFLVPEWPLLGTEDLRPAGADYRNAADEAALPGRIPPAEQAPTLLRITPLEPLREAGGDLELTFELEVQGPLSGFTVAGLVPVEMADLQLNAFGGYPALKGNGIFHAATLPVAALQPGFNRLRVPRPWAAGKLGMLHLLVRGRVSGGGPGFSNWTSIPGGVYRRDIRIAVNGDTGSGPIDTPPDGRILVTLAGIPDTSAPRSYRLERLSGLPLEFADSSRSDSGWLVQPARPFEVRLIGGAGSLRYDGLVVHSQPVSPGGLPAASGMSPLLRFPGAMTGTTRPRTKAVPARDPSARDALGRRLHPRRSGSRKIPAFSPPLPQ